MKLMVAFKDQLKTLGRLRYVWLTSFNIDIEFIETYLLPAILDMEQPKTRLDYEHFQIALTEKEINFRVFCDKRFMDADRNKRTAIPVHGMHPAQWEGRFSKESLFHPKVIYLEDWEGNRILGTGSANLTVSGWGRNQEVFSFQRIETKIQYTAVRSFFGEIATKAGLSEGLPERRGLPKEDGSWAFVHSFQEKPFINQLFKDAHAKELLVWSPYLSKDVSSFIQRLTAIVEIEELAVHLVPDRINGQFIRAPWTEALQSMCGSGVLSFYENPTSRHDNVELCHAKVWKLGNKLAIRSWNFTSRGANLPDADGRWDMHVNIEAGIIVKDGSGWSNAVGKKIEPKSADFAPDDLLDKEALEVPGLPPFDIQVQFDWGEQSYKFVGRWHEGVPETGYEVSVPGHKGNIPLYWRRNKKDLKETILKIRDPSALLYERRFRVIHDTKVIYCALVNEIGLKHRRAQAFESLNDLLDAFIFDGAPGSGDDVPFRIPTSQTSVMIVDEPTQDSQVEISPTEGNISYFRLFQATQKYSEKLEAISSVSELNSWVFTRPGCLIELVEKSRAKVLSGDPTLFSWFLAQEVRMLCRKAMSRHRHLRRVNDQDSLPKSRWDDLSLEIPPLPGRIDPEYVKLIQEECGYAN